MGPECGVEPPLTEGKAIRWRAYLYPVHGPGPPVLACDEFAPTAALSCLVRGW